MFHSFFNSLAWSRYLSFFSFIIIIIIEEFCLQFFDVNILLYHMYIYGCPRGVMVKALNCGIVVREFVLQSRYYVHFRANTLGKGMNPLILPPAMDK